MSGSFRRTERGYAIRMVNYINKRAHALVLYGVRSECSSSAPVAESRRTSLLLRLSTPPTAGYTPVWSQSQLRYAGARRSSQWCGSCAAPCLRTSKCRCGPVARPVAPTVATTSPARTRSPTTRCSSSQCAYLHTSHAHVSAHCLRAHGGVRLRVRPGRWRP